MGRCDRVELIQERLSRRFEFRCGTMKRCIFGVVQHGIVKHEHDITLEFYFH